jgi:methylamine dehydrogenase accessory protein MauD
MRALIFMVVFLLLAVTTLAVALFAMARQVGILFERISPMGALVTDAGPKIGERSPQFQLASLTGGETIIGGASARSTLIFFLSPTCPVCKKLIPILGSVRAGEGQWLDIVLASDGEEGSHLRFIEKAHLQTFPYVLSTELGLSYRVARLPYAVLLDPSGVIRAKGLINNREQLESLFNALEMNVASIQQFLNSTTELPRSSQRRVI